MMSAFTRPRALLLGLLLLFSAGCRGEDRVDVVVEDPQLIRLITGTPEFTGRLVNRGDERLASVQVQLALYDGDNVRVDRTFFVARDLRPGEPVPFRELLQSEADVHSARVESVIRL
jgi:hypothetical protein